MVRIQKPTSNVEDGIYTLRIGKSRTKTITDDKGNDIDRIEFDFTCLDGASEGEQFTDLTSDAIGKKSKLGQIYRAAKKTDEVPEDWDTADLEGKRFQALVQNNDSGYPRIVLGTIKPAKARPRPTDEEEDDTSSTKTKVGQTLDEAKRKANRRQAESDADDDWEDEDESAA
jgi:hypothetical protein